MKRLPQDNNRTASRDQHAQGDTKEGVNILDREMKGGRGDDRRQDEHNKIEEGKGERVGEGMGDEEVVSRLRKEDEEEWRGKEKKEKRRINKIFPKPVCIFLQSRV